MQVNSCRRLKYLNSQLLSNVYFSKKCVSKVYFEKYIWKGVFHYLTSGDGRWKLPTAISCYTSAPVFHSEVYFQSVFVRSVFLKCIIKVYFFIWPKVVQVALPSRVILALTASVKWNPHFCKISKVARISNHFLLWGGKIWRKNITYSDDIIFRERGSESWKLIKHSCADL